MTSTLKIVKSLYRVIKNRASLLYFHINSRNWNQNLIFCLTTYSQVLVYFSAEKCAPVWLTSQLISHYIDTQLNNTMRQSHKLWTSLPWLLFLGYCSSKCTIASSISDKCHQEWDRDLVVNKDIVVKNTFRRENYKF